jgi:ribosomal protein L27
MGVDYTGKGPLYALGDGTITQNDTASPWPGKTFIQLKLTSGPYKGRTIYYAENIQSQVRQGQTVKAGQLIGYARGTYPYTEIGWGTGSGETTSAAASGQAAAGQRAGDPGRYSTGYGMSMNALLHKLGAPAGQVDQPVQGSAG